MHILIALVGILGVAAVWYWRLKAIKETTDDVSDMAGRAWGKWKRYKFRKKAEAAPVEAVDDPVAASVIMMMAVAAEERPLTQTVETAIRDEVVKTMGIADPTELINGWHRMSRTPTTCRCAIRNCGCAICHKASARTSCRWSAAWLLPMAR